MNDKNEEVEKIVYTVSLVNGEKRVHMYDAPSSLKEAEKFLKSMAEMIALAMARGYPVVLYFENPFTCYNPDNVLGVEIGGMTAQEIQKAIRYAQRKAGLAKR